MKLFLSILVIFSTVSFSTLQKIRYDNCKIIKVSTKNLKEQTSIVEALEHLKECQILGATNDFKNGVDILVPQHKELELEELLQSHNLDFEVTVVNVQELIDKEQKKNNQAAFNWENYYSLDQIYSWLDEILAIYPNQTAPFEIGISYEGRRIRGIKISKKPNNPGIFIEANIHATEWISSATATYLINCLLRSDDSDIKEISENYDWYIIPVFNVDGFVYSHDHDRLWRKSRQFHGSNNNSTCIGVDINRNFDTHWMENGGGSQDHCSRNYAGPFPFSEPEARSLADYYKSVKDKISVYLALHSYGQQILSPYGYSADEFPSNFKDFQIISKRASLAIKRRFGTNYTYGSFGSILYIGSGTSQDWVFNNCGTPLSFTLELRDKGHFGFLLPPNQIIETATEIIDGIVAMLRAAKRLQYF